MGGGDDGHFWKSPKEKLLFLRDDFPNIKRAHEVTSLEKVELSDGFGNQ